nr:hypothetical protein [Tanacetum cinerariifolium]
MQTPQYPEVHPPSQEISDEDFQAKGDLMKSIQTFLEEFNCIPFEEKPKILLEAWDRSNFLNNDENHSLQNKKSLENSSNEIAASNSDQEKKEPPQDSDIQLVEICRQKELFCMHDNVDDLIESALNSKLLSINSNSQRLDKKEQEVKNVMEQPAKRGTHVEKSLQNFRVIHKSSISLNNTSQISSVHAVAPILSTKEPEHSQSMGDNKSLLDEDVPTEEFKVYSNPLFDDNEINSDKLDPHCFNVESDFVESLLNRDTFIDSSSKFDFFLKEFSGELAHINPEIKEADFDFEEEIHLIENLLYDNSSSRPPEEHNAKEERIKKEHAEYIHRMEMLFTINPRPRPTVNANMNVESIPSSLISVQDNDSQREEIDIVTNTDELLPPSFENDDSDGEIDAVDDLHADNSISNSEHELSDYEASDFDNPSFPRPPPKPPDAKFEPDSEEEISVVMNTIIEFECLYPRV